MTQVGKVRTRLLPGVSGDAVFAGDRQQYRPLLRRWTGGDFPTEFALFLGMNPSTAAGDFNDPTIAAEWRFTARWGYAGMAKVNVADYRMTDPKELASINESLVSAGNLPTIIEYAERAAVIVMAHGNLPKALREHGERVTVALRELGLSLSCFTKNADGSPKHSLYVKGDTVLVPF